MQRSEAVHAAAALLFPAEEAGHTALRETAALTVGLIDIRREAGLSPLVGQEVLAELAGATDDFRRGCARMSAVHAALAAAKVSIGASRVQANGGGDKADDSNPRPFAPFNTEGTLRVVA